MYKPVNRVRSICVHVSNMSNAIQWYSDLLGTPVSTPSHEGTIYDLPLQPEGLGLMLDANTALTEADGRHPLFLLETEDIQAMYHFLREKQAEICSEIQDIGSVYFFAFKDPDGNILMACQPK
ncbi:VOC family protein [Dictyobacter formicarum]|uniref:VOC domain-containing protein n=1 Tax=Dictyobacter formicarum TaxID=2778368 RepID=A0ABQ3VVA0_9CHLR|nr:VOC family protein [Dictyobacter formicarum]GHO89231.1 hypothetical protein KSZ_72370 [Dictyobacter formicarum]